MRNDITIDTSLLKEFRELLCNDHDPVTAMAANNAHLEF
jgi:hypothetical protein